MYSSLLLTPFGILASLSPWRKLRLFETQEHEHSSNIVIIYARLGVLEEVVDFRDCSGLVVEYVLKLRAAKRLEVKRTGCEQRIRERGTGGVPQRAGNPLSGRDIRRSV
jgi:hypothetical protein